MKFSVSEIQIKSLIKDYPEIIRFSIAFVGAIIFSVIINDIRWIKDFLADSLFIDFLLKITGYSIITILELLNYELIVDGILIRIDGTNGVLIVYGCLAFRHISLFIAFIFLYYGSFFSKLWFTLFGTILLIAVNIIRISTIAISQLPFPDHTDSIHFYFTRIIMYSTLFILWLIWLKRSEKN